MLDGQVALHANDNEYKNGRCVAKRMYEVICLAHEASEDPTATEEREKCFKSLLNTLTQFLKKKITNVMLVVWNNLLPETFKVTCVHSPVDQIH